MTDTLKTVIVDALWQSELRGLEDIDRREQNEREWSEEIEDEITVVRDLMSVQTARFSEDGAVFDLDRLATAVRDHVLDREKVRAALIAALVSENDFTNVYARSGCVTLNVNSKADKLVDRLIEGLAGKASA